ncbi:MAG TPA: nucleotidyltransferase domain-containing protein [Mycobacteriales bacterium]|nr:nucleotidyltransferase domain-containing protein [Mycobacteriales bacterium]
MPLPPAVSALVTERLDAVDAALPGFVTALWVTGSAASGDWRPDRSDVDFVAATDRVPTLADAEALAALHASPGEPLYDGLYVAESDLAAPPAAEQPAAHVTNGEFGTGPCGQCTPAAWLELRQDGVAVRGPAPAELVRAPEPAALRSWLLGNLRGYWSDTAGHAERVGAERPATAPVDGYPVVWMVLGAPRLHATLTTGRIVSKSAAGAYAAERFPDHAELAGRCVRWRAGEPVEFTMADGLRAAALIRAVVSAAETAAQAR